MGRVKENVYIGSRWKDNEKNHYINYCYQFVYALIEIPLIIPHRKKILCNPQTTKCYPLQGQWQFEDQVLLEQTCEILLAS